MKKLILAFLMLALLLYGFSVLADEGQGPDLSGEWAETNTQFTRMTVEKNPESGWDIEIVSPLTHGAYRNRKVINTETKIGSDPRTAVAGQYLLNSDDDLFRLIS